LAIVLSVLPFTDFDYPFGIFKLFLIDIVKITKDHISISGFFSLSITETMPYDESKTRRGTDKGKSGLSTKSSIEIDWR
jgi:hypothetical protein